MGIINNHDDILYYTDGACSAFQNVNNLMTLFSEFVNAEEGWLVTICYSVENMRQWDNDLIIKLSSPTVCSTFQNVHNLVT